MFENENNFKMYKKLSTFFYYKQPLYGSTCNILSILNVLLQHQKYDRLKNIFSTLCLDWIKTCRPNDKRRLAFEQKSDSNSKG